MGNYSNTFECRNVPQPILHWKCQMKTFSLCMENTFSILISGPKPTMYNLLPFQLWTLMKYLAYSPMTIAATIKEAKEVRDSHFIFNLKPEFSGKIFKIRL